MISEDGYIGARFEELSADIADCNYFGDNLRVLVNRVLRKAFTDPRLLEVLEEAGVLEQAGWCNVAWTKQDAPETDPAAFPVYRSVWGPPREPV